MDYLHDIFISCSAEKKAQEEWVNKFSALIKNIIDRILKRDTKILTSIQLESDEAFAKTAPVDVFSKTGVFIVIVDDTYASSSKSAQELATILSVVQRDASGNSPDRRIFKILLSDIKKAEQPDPVKNILPYFFYLKTDSGVEPVDFQKHKAYTEIRQFRLRLLDLAYNVFYFLRAATTKSNKTIYLAETGNDQLFNREVIKRELMHYGYHVLPDKGLPDDKDKLEKYIKDCLSFSSLAIHIYGSHEGSLIQGTNFNVVDFQNLVASKFVEEENGKLKRLIWIPPDLLFEEENQRVSIEKLKRSSEELIGAELVQTPIEEFKSILHRNLKEQQEVSDSPDTQTGLKAYVMFELKDKPIADEMISFLESSGIGVYRLDDNIEKHQMLSTHRNNMIRCDGVVIVADDPSGQWTRSKLNDVLKSMGFGRKKPYKVKALVTGGDVNSEKIKKDYIIINGRNGALKEQVKPFIEKLKN